MMLRHDSDPLHHVAEYSSNICIPPVTPPPFVRHIHRLRTPPSGAKLNLAPLLHNPAPMERVFLHTTKRKGTATALGPGFIGTRCEQYAPPCPPCLARRMHIYLTCPQPTRSIGTLGRTYINKNMQHSPCPYPAGNHPSTCRRRAPMAIPRHPPTYKEHRVFPRVPWLPSMCPSPIL